MLDMPWNRFFQPLLVPFAAIIVLLTLIMNLDLFEASYDLDEFAILMLTAALALACFALAVHIAFNLNNWLNNVQGQNDLRVKRVDAAAGSLGFVMEKDRAKKRTYRKGSSFLSPVLVVYPDIRAKAGHNVLLVLKNVKRNELNTYQSLLVSGEQEGKTQD